MRHYNGHDYMDEKRQALLTLVYLRDGKAALGGNVFALKDVLA